MAFPTRFHDDRSGDGGNVTIHFGAVHLDRRAQLCYLWLNMKDRNRSVERAPRARLWLAAIGVGLWLAVAGGTFALARWLTG